MEYKFMPDLINEIVPPNEGIISKVIHKDEFVNVTLFGFSKGQELSAHSAPTPAILQFLSGEAEVRLGDDTVKATRVRSPTCRPCCHMRFRRRVNA